MQPCVALLDAADGRLLAQATPPAELHRLSTRHVATAPDGLIAVGMQWEGDLGDAVPLVATWDGTGGLVFADEMAPASLALAGYTGAIAFDGSGRTIAATSPVGHSVGLWARDGLEPLASIPIPETCGLCADDGAGSFLASSGIGGIFRVTADGTSTPLPGDAIASRGWDNHLRRLIPIRGDA